jgi:hypothetical protein
VSAAEDALVSVILAADHLVASLDCDRLADAGDQYLELRDALRELRALRENEPALPSCPWRYQHG